MPKIEKRAFERWSQSIIAFDALIPLRNPEKVLDARYDLIRKIEQPYEILFFVPEVGDV